MGQGLANLNVCMHRTDHRHSEELRCQNEESADAVQGAMQHVWLLSPNRVGNSHLRLVTWRHRKRSETAVSMAKTMLLDVRDEEFTNPKNVNTSTLIHLRTSSKADDDLSPQL